MTTWEILVGNSTLPDNGVNTSYLHLLNQDGTGGGETIYLIGASTAELIRSLSTTINTSASVNITQPRLTAEITRVISAKINNTTETS